ncbi:hippurate hydrolase (plasmid) [Mesorhizobium sp. 131-2-5]|uniref:M20 aminoacylase family protein n=1 Tax=Mesorhizobium sp. 131-2-5 TaxID=2744519 RepID=UPI0018EAD38A|nr:M20 aminoacylase family protein [Mesorhizobium sp. 131-2-5]BCH05066.1 hippurate hydrolase [Mesorhizobium sp. 131-2-5]
MTFQAPPQSITTEAAMLDHADEFVALRRKLHSEPELAYHEKKTSVLVAERLRSWGYDVTEKIGGTGVVGTLRNGLGQKSIGIRADMDALPVFEATGLPYASTNPGVMHACGHDGHTAILLAAARHLAKTRDFSGTLRLIFQPAEEGGAGAKAMISDGLFERFPVDAVFGLHNWPGVPAGQFAFLSGPAMASVDLAIIKIIGKGGHGARPSHTVDPIVAAASLVMALQTIVSRNVDPLETAVVTVGTIHGGIAANVIPDSVELKVTIRTFSETVRDQIRTRIIALAEAQAQSYGATAEITYPRGYPTLVNHPEETEFARQVALRHFGAERIETNFPLITASEDFAFMLERRPGSYLFIGNGDSADLHSPNYDFNDDILPDAARYWVALVQDYLAANEAPRTSEPATGPTP